MDEMVDAMRVKPGVAAGLASRDPRDKLGLEDKAEAAARRDVLGEELGELHERLWAEAERSVLLVLQGMDTAGKDSTIRRVLSGLNPQGCQVASFKVPTEAERAQDYLWRVHAVCPPRGQLGVFNRSHYEDVLAARMVGVVDGDRCRQRYRHLREFERMLTEEGTHIVKVFLHISKDEQRERLQERVEDPVKNWKFKLGDLDVRKQWDEYQDLYEEVITETSTGEAPWYVVPADRKWVRDVAVESLLVRTMKALDPKVPPSDPELDGIVVE